MSVKLFVYFIFHLTFKNPALRWSPVFCELLFLYIGGEVFQSFGSKGWFFF